jgi:hypothetical protein
MCIQPARSVASAVASCWTFWLCRQRWARHLEPVGGRGGAPAGDLGFGRIGAGEGAPVGWDADGLVEPFDPARQAQAEEPGGVSPVMRKRWGTSLGSQIGLLAVSWWSWPPAS